MIPTVDYIRILPELVLSIFGIIIMVVDPALPPKGNKRTLGMIGLVGVLLGLGRQLSRRRISATRSSIWCVSMPSASSSIS